MESFIQSPLFLLRCLVLIVGLALSLSRAGKAQKIITGAVLFSALALFTGLFVGNLIPYWISLIALPAGILIYTIGIKERSITERICIAVMGISFHLKCLAEDMFRLPAWPFDLLQMSSVLLFIYLLASARFKKFPPETGFLFIWSVFILLDFVEYFVFGPKAHFYFR